MNIRTIPTFRSVETYNNIRLILKYLTIKFDFVFIVILDKQKRPITITTL